MEGLIERGRKHKKREERQKMKGKRQERTCKHTHMHEHKHTRRPSVLYAYTEKNQQHVNRREKAREERGGKNIWKQLLKNQRRGRGAGRSRRIGIKRGNRGNYRIIGEE